ncbi:C-X-C chemokine receptor type 2-like protein [Labeo rohita]|uniref:C-X-C chemokine receptor type 2-like protein n=1 Tax=Labeo rohita TaxID=84645 RepID=A0A498NKU2_LABRO|nr:C-X-C chemokine receptor type 2-like protein [Labeo rohita]
MLSLAVSDLLSLIFLPVWIYALLNGWIFGQGLCKFFSYVVYWSLYSTVLSVTLLSLQRYLQVLYPQRWAKLGQKGQNGLIFAIWTSSGVLASYALYYRNAKKKYGRLRCYQDYTNKEEQIVVLLVETLVMFVVPLFSLLYFFQGLCKFFSYVVYWSLYSTVLSVTLLSLQRYLQVLYPQRWAKLGQKGQNGLIFAIWTSSGVLASYALYYRNAKKKYGRLRCYQDYTNKEEQIVVLLVETLVMFVVPLFSLLYFYCRLHQRINQSAFFRSHRLKKLVIRIVVAFFIFSTPCMINNLVLMAMPLKSAASNNVTGALFFINSCVNPFLYAFSARTLRCKRKQHSDQPQQNQNETQ